MLTINKIENIWKKKTFRFILFASILIFIFPSPWILAIVLIATRLFEGWVWVSISLFIWPIFLSILIGFILFSLFKKIRNMLEENGDFNSMLKSVINSNPDLANNIGLDLNQENLNSKTSSKENTSDKIDKSSAKEAEIINDK